MVRPIPFRLVLDTNILVRGLLKELSPSGRILRGCESRTIIPIVSKPVLAEYRAILSGPDLTEQYPQLEARRVKAVLERLTYVADMIRSIREQFELPRDPKDAKLVELCIAGKATHLLSADPDLLDLGDGHDQTARQFRQRLPAIEVMKPHEFVDRYGILLNLS